MIIFYALKLKDDTHPNHVCTAKRKDVFPSAITIGVHDMAFTRRIFCLLENQQPLVMDSMGTGYLVAKGEVQEQRPAPLRHAHVQAFRNRYG